MNPHFDHLRNIDKSLVIPKGEGQEPYQDLPVHMAAEQPLQLSLADPNDVMVTVAHDATNTSMYVDAKYLAHTNCSDCEHVWTARVHDIDKLDDARLFTPLAIQPPALTEISGGASEPPLLAHINDIPAVQAALGN